jgi:hypothetical protein
VASGALAPEPVTFAVGAHTYAHRRLSAAQQFTLLRRLEPAFPTLSLLGAAPAASGGPEALARALAPLRTLDDATLDGALDACQAAVLGPAEAAPLTPAELVLLMLSVFSHNFTPMLNQGRPVNAEETPRRDRGYGQVGPARMPDGLDWLYAPVVAEPPLCSLAELHDGTYRIEDVALMNDLLRVKAENAARWQEANRTP